MALTAVSMLIWSSVIVLPLTYLAFVLLQNYRVFRRRAQLINMLPGDDPHWLSGHLHQIAGPNEEGMAYMRSSGTMYPQGLRKFWYGPLNPSVGLFHHDSVKTILKTSEPKPRKIGGYFMLEPWLGDGLLLSRGPKWARNRRLLTPAFHFDILRPYMEVNNRCVDVFLEKLGQYANRGESIEMLSNISLLTLDIILRCAFSYDNDCQIRGETHPYVSAIHSLQTAATDRLLSPWLYPDFIFKWTPVGRAFQRGCKFVHDISDEIINKRREALLREDEVLKKKGRYLDFLDILLTAKDDSGTGLTHQEIRDEVDTFLFEGHDTTASGISWALWSLAAHPQHQEKCQQEIDEILSTKENKDIDWDDLPKLKYLTMCLKESLRMHTPVPFIERETTKDLMIEGYSIPAGTLVDIHLYVLHHNERIWGNPEEYKPERFGDESSNELSSFAFVPFSAGPRNCIGQHFAMHEMKTTIAKTLSRFTLSLDSERPTKHRIAVVMKTEDGMYIKATPRSQITSAL